MTISLVLQVKKDIPESRVIQFGCHRFLPNPKTAETEFSASCNTVLSELERTVTVHGVRMVLIESFLSEQRVGFAMPEISRRRSDQFRDFMAVLELGAIDSSDRVRIADKRLRRGFYCPCLSGTGGAQE